MIIIIIDIAHGPPLSRDVNDASPPLPAAAQPPIPLRPERCPPSSRQGRTRPRLLYRAEVRNALLRGGLSYKHANHCRVNAQNRTGQARGEAGADDGDKNDDDDDVSDDDDAGEDDDADDHDDETRNDRRPPPMCFIVLSVTITEKNIGHYYRGTPDHQDFYNSTKHRTSVGHSSGS